MSVVSMSITTYTCILDTELKGNRNENTICMEPWTRNIYVRGSAMPRASTSIDTEMVSLWSSICQNVHKEICIRTEWIWSCCKHDTASSRLCPSNSQSREQPQTFPPHNLEDPATLRIVNATNYEAVKISRARTPNTICDRWPRINSTRDTNRSHENRARAPRQTAPDQIYR